MAALKIQPPKVGQLDPPRRLMLGPGPSNAHPRVYQAMAMPQVGHLDHKFLEYVEEVKNLIRYAWQTENQFTVPISATASAAWEACVANLVEPGEKVLTFVNGYFGLRNMDIASRYGAENIEVKKEWGKAFSFDEIKAAILEHKPTLVHITHSETSTGVVQNVEGVGDVCREVGALFLLDVVTSTGAVPVLLDQWKVDACYGGGQKNLACPPGIAPMTFGPRAMEKLTSRKSKVPNWYLDMNMIAQYIGKTAGPRVYHHTAPISMVYALRESLLLLSEETLEEAWKRHRATADFFYAGLDELGLECLVEKDLRSPSLTTVKIPADIDGVQVQKYLLEKYNIELGGGLGELKGKVWRVGLMGYNSNFQVVTTLLGALKDALNQQRKK